MLADERREIILQTLRDVDLCTVKDLVDQLDVSRITVVRDLDFLEKSGMIVRVHGGARLNREERPGSAAKFKVRMNMNLDKKQAIGVQAANLVADISTIFIDSSTTGYIFAQELMKRKRHFTRLNIITNSPSILTTVTENANITVISTGGELNTLFNMFGGLWVVDFLERVNIDSAFISASGISRELNLTTGSIDIANILRKVLEKSTRINLLADSSKMCKQEMLNIFPLARCHLLVTDSGITQEEDRTMRTVTDVLIAP